MQHKSEYIWALIGRVVPLLIYLGTTMILARFLTPDDFGMVGVLSIFLMVAQTLMDAGLGGSLIKEKEISNLDCSTIFVFNIVVSIILYVLIFIFAGTIENYFSTPDLSIIVRILCSVFIVNAFGLVPTSLLMRHLRFRIITIINISSVIIAAIAAIVLALSVRNVYALVTYQLVCAFITVTLSSVASKYKWSLKFSLASLRHLLPFGIFTTLSNVIDTVYENLTTFFFGKYLNMQQAGFLSQAKRLEEVPTLSIVQTINSVAFPLLNQLRNDQMTFAKECTETFKVVMLLILPLLAVLAFFSEPIILLVLGYQWTSAAPYLTLLVLAAVFRIAETLNRTFIKSTTKVQELFRYTLIKRVIGIAIILFSLYIEPSFMLYAYIISTFIGYIVNAILLSHISVITFSTQSKLFISTLLPSIAFYLTMIAVRLCFNSLVIEIFIGILLLLVYYFLVLRLYDINIISFCLKFFNKN